jgi:hypothetical protein
MRDVPPDLMAGLKQALAATGAAESLLADLLAHYRALQRDPLSGQDWPSGFGQCAPDLVALQAWRNRPCGHYTAWTDFSRQATTWDAYRGGPAGQLDVTNAFFSPVGMSNFLQGVKTLDPLTPVTLVFPLVPTEVSNARQANPGQWAYLLQNELAMLRQAYHETGFRLARLWARHDKPFDLLTLDLGHEQSGDWYPWSCGPDVRSFQELFRWAVDGLRRGACAFDWRASRLKIEFRVAGSNKTGAKSLEELVPWDVVDVLGRSLHEDPGKPWGTETGWRYECLHQGFGLEDALTACRLHRKPLALNEWAVQRTALAERPASPDPAAAIARVHAFCAAHADLLHSECYLHSKTTRLVDGGWAGAEAYQRLFGAPLAPGL